MKKTADYVLKFVDCTTGFNYTTKFEEFDCMTRFADYLTNIQIKIVFFAYISAKVLKKIFAKMLVVEMFVVEMLVVEMLVVFFT